MPPPLPQVPAATGRVAVGSDTFAGAAARSARFDVEWGANDATPSLVPASAGATQLVASGGSAARLTGIAGALALHAGDGPNRIGRITFALDEDSYVAARLLPRAEFTLGQAPDPGSGAAAASELVRTGAAQLRAQDADAEFLPRADEIIVGPEASQTLLGLPGDGSIAAATPTRATYVLRHELAHASQPVSVEALSRRETHVFEEARADLVARGDARLPEFGRRLGLAFDAQELAADATYPYQRGIVAMFLNAAGMSVGSPTATQLLASTPGERIPEAIGAALAARIGGDPASLAQSVRTASSSMSATRGLLTTLGFQVD